MKENHFKYLAISFFIIIIWILFGFLGSYVAEENRFSTFNLYFYFFYSILLSVAFGLIAIILRLIFFKKNIFKYNFFYLFSGIWNLMICGIWITSIMIKLLDKGYPITEYILINLFIAGITLIDFYFIRKSQRQILNNSSR